MTTPLKLFIYCRKSTETDDKQVLSIESQITEMTRLAQRKNYQIVEIFRESKSAKAPGRPIFNQMMERLYKNHADGVLCWKLDRLARNPVDGGAIIWQAKDNSKYFVTNDMVYAREYENLFYMYFEFGMAQKSIDDLGKNAKRGMKTKAEMGWYPAPAPTGYINIRDKRYLYPIIAKDEDRFEKVQQMFKAVLQGKIPAEVWKTAVIDWKLTSRSNKPLCRADFYYILKNPFYTGEFEWPLRSDNWYVGKHEAMITKEEFIHVQIILGKKGRQRRRTHEFSFTGVFRCGECGCMISASEKTKYFKKTNNVCTYTYYHCTKKNKAIKCKQAPITKKEFEKQITGLLEDIYIEADFLEYARKWLTYLHEKEKDGRNEASSESIKQLEISKTKLDKLLDWGLEGKIDEITYKQKHKQILDEISRLEKKIASLHVEENCWHFELQKKLDYANTASKRFTKENHEGKRDMVVSLGVDFKVKNRNVLIQLDNPFEILEKSKNTLYEETKWNVPVEYIDMIGQRPDLKPTNLNWLPNLDSNQDTYFQRVVSYR
jgi:site-specific DNA recombinase